VTEKYVESTQVEKIVHRLKGVLVEASEHNPNMYNKTKIRYREMAAELLSCVEIIADMIEEDLLNPPLDADVVEEFEESAAVDEFEESAVSQKQIEEQKEQTAEIKQKLKNIEKTLDRVEKQTPVPHNDPKNRKTIKMVGRMMAELPDKEYETYYGRECAEYLSKWWRVRFNPDHKNPNFRYNMRNIPEWVASIVIAYGKYIHDGKAQTFKKEFDTWLKSVETDMKNVYSTPFFIRQLFTNKIPTNYVDEADVTYRDLYFNGIKPVWNLRRDLLIDFTSGTMMDYKYEFIPEEDDEEEEDDDQ